LAIWVKSLLFRNRFQPNVDILSCCFKIFVHLFFFFFINSSFYIYTFVDFPVGERRTWSFCLFFHSLLSIFLLIININLVLSQNKFVLNFIKARCGPIEPWMCLNVCNWRSEGWFVRKHGCDQILEFLTKETCRFVLWMCFPENVSSVSTNKFIEVFIRDSLSKWRMLCNHNKQDNTASKYVNCSSIVRFFQMDLRSHITLCAKFSY